MVGLGSMRIADAEWGLINISDFKRNAATMESILAGIPKRILTDIGIQLQFQKRFNNNNNYNSNNNNSNN